MGLLPLGSVLVLFVHLLIAAVVAGLLYLVVRLAVRDGLRAHTLWLEGRTSDAGTASTLNEGETGPDARVHPLRSERERRRQVRRAVVLGLGGVYAVLLVFGVVDTLVWLPQYLAPAVPLDQIYVVLGEAGNMPGVVIAPVLWLVIWAAVAAAFVVVLLPANRALQHVADRVPLPVVVGIGLVVFGAMSFFEWFSAFGMAMNVSDELLPGIGGNTPLGEVIFSGGTAVGLLGGAVWIVAALRGARARGTAAS